MLKYTLSILFFVFSISAQAFDFEPYQYSLRTSVYTKHFHPSPEHNNNQQLINIEAENKEQWLVGAAFFKNSFYQPTEYIYVGKKFSISDSGDTYFKLTGGILHGYKGEHQKNIPFNNKNGFAPSIIPAVGTNIGPVNLEVVWFGAGAMVNAGFHF